MQQLESLEPAWLRDCPSLPENGDTMYEPAAAPSADGSSAVSSAGGPSARRFVFLDLIAQGGFSSVFRAYDEIAVDL